MALYNVKLSAQDSPDKGKSFLGAAECDLLSVTAGGIGPAWYRSRALLRIIALQLLSRPEPVLITSAGEREQSSRKWAREHASIFVLSGPNDWFEPVAGDIFADEGIKRTFARHRPELVKARNFKAHPRLDRERWSRPPSIGYSLAAPRLTFCQTATLSGADTWLELPGRN